MELVTEIVSVPVVESARRFLSRRTLIFLQILSLTHESGRRPVTSLHTFYQFRVYHKIVPGLMGPATAEWIAILCPEIVEGSKYTLQHHTTSCHALESPLRHQ